VVRSQAAARALKEGLVRRNLGLFLLLAGVATQGNAQKKLPRSHGKSVPAAGKAPLIAGNRSFKPPDPASIPMGPLGDSIRFGLQIFTDTPQYAPAYVGNLLSCSDCHLQDGTSAYASPLAGVPGLFPMYKARARRVITFEDRIQECFTRSENGRPLPYRSPELIAIVAYIQWLSQGLPAGRALPSRGLVKLPPLHGDPAKGAGIYARKCAGCHQADGGGVPPAVPPLWGPNSFNDGAGMSHVAQMAAFVQHNMPPNQPGTLTPQQAFDVAAYVDSKPRPKFNSRYATY
jgi:thiosulfate dehydrogenase